MPLKDKEHDECVQVIDTLHDMAHKGAFKNIDFSIFSKFMDFCSDLMNVKITPKQAEELFPNTGHTKIRNTLYRKIIPQKLATKITENTSMVSLSVWKRFLS